MSKYAGSQRPKRYGIPRPHVPPKRAPTPLEATENARDIALRVLAECTTELKRIEARLAAAERLLRTWARVIVDDGQERDWACAQCDAGRAVQRVASDSIVEGFVCIWHEARAFLAQLSSGGEDR